MIVTGIVERGKQLGRRLGFPTANIRPDWTDGPLPENGVYAAAFWVEEEPLARPCMLNQGVHPTVPEGRPTIEAHLLDYDGALYGRRVRVEYLHFMRPERRFEDVGALAEQLRRDRRCVRDWIAAARAPGCRDPFARRVQEIRWID